MSDVTSVVHRSHRPFSGTTECPFRLVRTEQVPLSLLPGDEGSFSPIPFISLVNPTPLVLRFRTPFNPSPVDSSYMFRMESVLNVKTPKRGVLRARNRRVHRP